MFSPLVVATLGVALAAAAPSLSAKSGAPQLNYSVGQLVAYQVRGGVIANGQDVNGSQLGDGLAFLNGTMMTRCVDQNATHYEFAMNMFAVSVSNDGGHSWHQVSSDELGADINFIQAKTGEVVEVTYSKEDDELVTNVKMGAINALHTFLVPAGNTEEVTESTAVGTHVSTVTGADDHPDLCAECRLRVQKTFDQAAIKVYADPNLKEGQMNFGNDQFVTQHAEGYLHSASTHQEALLMHASVDDSGAVTVSGAPSADETMDTNFSSSLHSRGQLNLTFVKPPPALAAAARKFTSKKRSGRALSPSHVVTTLFGYARDRVAAAAPTCPANEKTCAYAPGKTMCCHSGHYCVPNVGCTCQGDDCSPKDPSPVTAQRARRDSDFPYNRSYAHHATIGPHGKHNWDTLYANYSADLFVGTNFDCHQPTFNYEAEAHVESWIDVFGSAKQAFYAQFIYGADNGQQLANQVVVNAWGKQIYQKALPTVDCSPHTVPVAHKEPGFDKKFTIWTSFIPVTLHITTALTLDLSYTWQICDTDLSASISLNPKAALTVTGSAAVNLLVLDTTTELTSTFSQALVPTLALKGSECKVDFTVERKSDPMTAEFHSFYKYKKCKFLVFDCHWTNRYDKVWWSWEHPAEDKVEYTKQYNITL